MKYYLVGCLLVLVALVSAATTIETRIHILKSGNSTYVWSDDLTPKVCINGTSGSCMVKVEVPACDACTLNSTALAEIRADVKTLRTDMVGVGGLLRNVNSSISTSVGSIIKKEDMSNLLDKFTTDISTLTNQHLNEQATQLKNIFSDINATATLRVDLEKANGLISTCQVQSSAQQTQLDEANAENERMLWVLILLIIVFLFFMGSYFNLFPGARRKMGV